MPSLNINIPPAVAARVADAFVGRFGQVLDSLPETATEKEAFVREKLIEYIKDVVKNHEEEVATRVAAAAAVEEVNVT